MFVKKNGVSDSNSLKMACIGLILGSRKLFCRAVKLRNLGKSDLCRIPFYSKNFNVFIFRQNIFTGKTRFLIRFRSPVFSAHRTVHGGFAVLLRTSCYEFVVMILYCINMLDMKYACYRVDMCCVGWGWIWGKWRHTCPYLGLTKSRVVFVQER